MTTIPDNTLIPVQKPINRRSPMFSPVNSYCFNDSTGLKDGSGSADMINSGLIIESKNRVRGDGISKYAESPLTMQPAYNSYTISCKLKAFSMTQWDGVVSHLYKSTPFNGLGIWCGVGNRLRTFNGPYTNSVDTTNPIILGREYIVDVTADDDGFRIYVNGVVASPVGALSPFVSASVSMRLLRSASPSEVFDGEVGEVAFYDYPLTAEQIAFKYAQSVPDDSLILEINNGKDYSKYRTTITKSNCITGNNKMVFSNGGLAWASQTFTSYEYSYNNAGSYIHYFYDGTNTYTNGVLTGSMPVSIGATGFSGVTASMQDIRCYNTAKTIEFAKLRYINARRYW